MSPAEAALSCYLCRVLLNSLIYIKETMPGTLAMPKRLFATDADIRQNLLVIGQTNAEYF
jgi:hypothetical protein